MAHISRKRIQILPEILTKIYKNLDVQQVSKIVKAYPRNILIDALNQLDDIKAVIFVMTTCENYKPLKLIRDLSFDKISSVLSHSSDAELKIILKYLYPDDLFELLNEFSDFSKRIMFCINKERRQEIKKISSYDEDQAGHIMNPKFLAIQENWTVGKSIAYIRSEIENVEMTTTIFINNEDNKFVGSVKIYDIFFAKSQNIKISSLITTNHVAINATYDIEDVISMFDKYSIETLAVVNGSNQLVGFIRHSDITSAMLDETTEDIYKMYGITELHTPYLRTSVWKIARSRLLWLSILMISATLTSIVLDQFQFLSETLTAGISSLLLVPLIPVLTGTSGNAGSQASASIIRSLSIGEITNKEYCKAISKEAKVGILVGTLLALTNFVRLLCYNAAFNQELLNNLIENYHVNMTYDELYVKNMVIAAASSFTLFISIFIAKTIGSSLPLLATKLKIDPTVMSAPILATILDVLTTTTLFGIGIFVVEAIFQGYLPI